MPFRPPAPFDNLCTVAIDVDFSTRFDSVASEFDWSSIPTEAGVVILADANSKPVLIRGIGDPRAFVRRRLDADASDDPSPRVDYRTVVRSVCVIPAGHALLAELLANACEGLIDAELARSSTARMGACFVVADGTARLPVFRCVDWRELWDGSAGLSPHDTVLGPFVSAKRAKRWIEHAIDLFDLCRYDHLLAQTPNAVACVYKQMGKCPAPCDGTEPLESYRDRFRRALAFVGATVTSDRDETTSRMEAASASLDFEAAASLKQRLDTLDALISGGAWDVCDLRESTWRIAGQTGKIGWLRHCTLTSNGLALDGDAREGHPASESAPGSAATLPLGDRAIWLLLATLVESWQAGLAAGERVDQDVREPGSEPA